VYYAYWKFVATATNLFSLETYSTNVNVEGNNGLPEGKYSLTITPDITVTCIKKKIIQDIIVEIGQTKLLNLLICCRNTM
jgi:hypothetical protein